jgi:hypothetical protein
MLSAHPAIAWPVKGWMKRRKNQHFALLTSSCHDPLKTPSWFITFSLPKAFVDALLLFI